MGTLHDADRGGFIFAPEVGLHDDVHELDFSSLYPNIICTQNVAALKRAREQDLAVHPGQDIEYVIVDDEKSSRDRVALAHEEIETYDASYYETQLVRAVESVLSPLGIDRTDIRKKLSPEKETVLSSFGAVNDTS
jgi:DNA polymerase I